MIYSDLMFDAGDAIFGDGAPALAVDSVCSACWHVASKVASF